MVSGKFKAAHNGIQHTPIGISEATMTVIHPGLFLLLRRFPNHKDAIRRVYHSSESFQSICHNYQKCSEALDYWAKSSRLEAPDRYLEYKMLLQELEMEIKNSLEE
jgi:hypothetical protein